MKSLALILTVFLVTTARGQTKIVLNFSNKCEPPPLIEKIAASDTVPIGHTFCVTVYFFGNENKFLMSSSICDTTYDFFGSDSSTIGWRKDEYYDSNGNVHFEIERFKGTILGCLRNQYDNSAKLIYQEGYRLGELVRIYYEYNLLGKPRRITNQTEKITVVQTF